MYLMLPRVRPDQERTQGFSQMLDFLSPSEVRTYNPEQIMYMLSFCLDGHWPQKESNCTDAPFSHSSSKHMPHETEILVIAELTFRIRSCGTAGDRLYKELNAQSARNPDRVVCLDDLPYNCRQVVLYCSGACRRVQDCGPCPIDCKRRGRKPCTFNQYINKNR